MNIKYFEKILNAQYIGQYSSGHMGSQILRFRRRDDDLPIVLKLADSSDLNAINDIGDNVFGYQEIARLGGRMIIPPEVKEIVLADGRALLLTDLGSSIKTDNRGREITDLVWNKFKDVVISTKRDFSHSGESVPSSAHEVINHLRRFSQFGVEKTIAQIKKLCPPESSKCVALMLLDFTPDNLFINQASVFFIDPWRQSTYLGNPAVSIGQFITLAKIYQMLDADEISDDLQVRCLRELPLILECSEEEVKMALRLGTTLQLALSAYVRRESKPVQAIKLLNEANLLWLERIR